MSKIEKMCQPLNAHEDNFIVMISTFSGIGYGRMKQIITGLWVNILMESSDMDEECALLGALDLDSWTQVEKEKLQHQLEIQTKRVENLKKSNEFYAERKSWRYSGNDRFDCNNGGKLARSCQAIDQELEKELENLK